MDIAALKAFCRAIPGTTVDTKWGNDQCFSVGEKMYAVFGLDENDRQGGFSLKAGEARFLELTDQPGIRPAPYLARAHWVLIEPACQLSQEEIEVLLLASFKQVLAKLPAKVRKPIEAQLSQ